MATEPSQVGEMDEDNQGQGEPSEYSEKGR